MQDVYITDLAVFLPNAPVENDAIEGVLGMVGGRPSRARRVILGRNGITTRHYAIDAVHGTFTHNNSEMAAHAVRLALERAHTSVASIDCLACGTSSPDQFKPGHAHMVHGALAAPPCEVASLAGVCTAGATALKYAYFTVATGSARLAVSTGSEFASSFMRAEQFGPEPGVASEAQHHPLVGFEKDFLRWMLSDGAGAAVLQSRPNEDRLSLRIDWIDCLSYAGELPVCMYSGADLEADGRLRGWREVSPQEAVRKGFFTVKQDARRLDQYIVDVSVTRALQTIIARHGLRSTDIDWFLPHYSSEYFRAPLHEALTNIGFPLTMDRWFSNMAYRGNIGSAMMYSLMEELLYSGRIRRGDRLLCMIPESARFAVCYVHLTAV